MHNLQPQNFGGSITGCRRLYNDYIGRRPLRQAVSRNSLLVPCIMISYFGERCIVGYRFQGFFSDGDETTTAAALDRWPFCIAKHITTPFRGFGLRAPDPDRLAETEEQYELLVELPFAVERDLVEFSRRFPAAKFVFIDADCHGGACIYTGFVVQAGEVSLRETAAQTGTEPLQRLLKPLGVRLQSEYFEPFTRGYW